MARPHGQYARVNPQNPEAFAQCDRCGFWRNMSDLVWQVEWAGTHIYNERILVCQDRCFDTPQEQFRTIILPPDPPPILNARVPNFAYEEQTIRILQFNSQPFTVGQVFEADVLTSDSGIILTDDDGDVLTGNATTLTPGLPNPPWGAGPQVVRSVQGLPNVARIIQLRTSS